MAIDLITCNAGNVDITSDKIDITDPCYSKDTWCRVNDLNIQPGNYECIAYFGYGQSDDEFRKEYNEWAHKYYETFEKYKEETLKDIKSRIFRLIMYINDPNEPMEDLKNWESIGDIGVDAGLAGFIWNQNTIEWDKLIEIIEKDEKETYKDDDTEETFPHTFHLIENYGFFCSSGYGDGSYPAYVIKRNDKIVALRIDF